MSFNTSQEISIKLHTGNKNVVVQFPTDEQLIARMHKQKTISRSLGRGKTTTETTGSEKANLDLFNQIKVSGDDLDEYEATEVINRLSRAEVTDAVREGNQFTIHLTVPGAKTVHTVKMPSAKQLMEYRRNVVSVIEGRRGTSEIRMNLRPAGDLYDALAQPAQGYEDSVPVIHKSAVISEVIAMLEGDEDESEVEGF